MTLVRHDQVQSGRRGFSRRSFLHRVSATAAATGMLSFRDVMSLQAEELRRENRSMILLWMAGGPSQFETFDPKPGMPTGGSTEAIATRTPGLQFAKGWEKTAAISDKLAVIRSMTNKEGSHPRASYQLHTGYIPSGSVKHPSLGSNLAYHSADPEFDLPSVVSIGRTQGAGYLGVDYEPFVVDRPGQLPSKMAGIVLAKRQGRRLGLLNELEGEFAERGARNAVDSHRSLYRKTADLVTSPELNAFKIDDEPANLVEQYGDSDFGRGCLLARRLVETGVTFVEVVSRGWDTHFDNFERVATNSSQVDPASAALIQDLEQRGMLDNTLVVWMGEFGRTPKVNGRTGRDHFPRAFNLWMAGGGVQGGQVVGATSRDGSSVKDDPVTVSDLYCSICQAMKLDPRSETMSPLGRPMKIIEEGKAVSRLFI